MKRKKYNKLSCERARAFPIEKALAKLGHFPTRSNEKEAWFPSPFRPEAQASFKVSKELNRWYDHGEGTGGNVIDLVCRIKGCTVKETLKFLNTDQTSFSFQQQPVFQNDSNKENKLTVIYARPLTHIALRRYLFSRGISMVVASRFCREVHYMVGKKRYFAIGLKNSSGGWELRNRYFKNCSSPKDITHIKNGNSKLIITEGMFDLLSLLEDNGEMESGYDLLVLNSTAFFEKALEIVKGYSHIELYLDNDGNGKRTAERFMENNRNCKDRSMLYEGFKDMNERLVHKHKKGLGQGTQDVSLLPQRQSCFAPDGRKVGKK